MSIVATRKTRVPCSWQHTHTKTSKSHEFPPREGSSQLDNHTHSLLLALLSDPRSIIPIFHNPNLFTLSRTSQPLPQSQNPDPSTTVTDFTESRHDYDTRIHVSSQHENFYCNMDRCNPGAVDCARKRKDSTSYEFERGREEAA